MTVLRYVRHFHQLGVFPQFDIHAVMIMTPDDPLARLLRDTAGWCPSVSIWCIYHRRRTNPPADPAGCRRGFLALSVRGVPAVRIFEGRLGGVRTLTTTDLSPRTDWRKSPYV